MGREGWTNGPREKTKDWPVFGGSISRRHLPERGSYTWNQAPPQISLFGYRITRDTLLPLDCRQHQFLASKLNLWRLISSCSVLGSKQVWQMWNWKYNRNWRYRIIQTQVSTDYLLISVFDTNSLEWWYSLFNCSKVIESMCSPLWANLSCLVTKVVGKVSHWFLIKDRGDF